MKLVGQDGCFSSAYVINLKERKDRRRAISKELRLADFPLAPGSVELFSAIKPSERMGFPSLGARGCFLSHLGVYRLALERKLENVLVVEDDLLLSPLIRSSTEFLSAELRRQPWGLLYLGHRENVAEQSLPRLIPFSQPIETSHFYAVNGPVIPRLVSYLEEVQRRDPGDPLGGPMHLDGALSMFRQANPDVITLIVEPNLGRQRPSRSDINCPWYERLPVIKQASDLARFVRESLRG